MSGLSPEAWLGLLGLALLLLALGLWLGLGLASRRVARRVERSRRQGVAGEDRAEELLAELGYEVVRWQASEKVVVEVDGEALEALVRVDFLVTRDGRLYAAEAKGGAVAADPSTSATRRQLLEYAVAFDVDGVLLVDAARGEVREVRFPLLD